MRGRGNNMRKLLPIILSVLLLLTVFTIPDTYAEDAKEIKFGDIAIPEGYAELDSHTPSYSYQLWHYSGGYWGNNIVKLMDEDVAEGIDNRGVIEYKHPVTIKTDLPAKVKEHLTNGGSLDDILIKFELTNGLQDVEIFSNTPTYSINNDQITVSFEPKFAVKKKHLVDHPGMKVHVPTIPEGYGKMVYAVYTPGGTHLGASDETYINPEDIIDCDGNLRADKMYGYNLQINFVNRVDGPIEYLPGGKIKIGYGTFANGGAVGLEYLFPIKATYYVGAGGPDFFPTPEGSTEWKPQYKDPKYCAKTYTYEQGQTEITFPVNLYNQGEEAITDFKAVWFNSSKVNPKPWDSPVWEAKEIDRHGNGNNPYIEKPVAHPNAGGTEENPITQPEPGIKLAKGESKTFEVTVPLPVPDYAEGMLAFKCNVDGKTPANEVNQENNIMIIKIEEAGVDVVTLMPDELIYLINSGEVADVFVPLTIIREDTSPKPVDVDIKYSGPFGSVNKQATLAGFYSIGNDAYYEMHFKLSKPGTYKVYAEAWPISITDINPANNKAETRIIVKLKKQYDAEKINPDNQTRVNLRS